MTRRQLLPFETEISHLADGGIGVGQAPDGRPVHVRCAPAGARVRVVPAGRSKGVWRARRDVLLRPPAEGVDPECALFGVCGGCCLQELSLEAQRRHKADLAVRQVLPDLDSVGVTVHPVRGSPLPYGYRNKVELCFGTRRYVSDAEMRAGAPLDGRFLGFHAPGRFDRVVDVPRCPLVSETMNDALAIVRNAVLPSPDPLWDVRSHSGHWREIVLREGDGVLAGLYTNPDASAERVRSVANELLKQVCGVVWVTNAGVAQVAAGDVREVFGADRIEVALRGVRFRLSLSSFFQTSTSGAVVLYDTIAEALGPPRGTLLDLYSGVGAIGLALHEGFDRVVGVEESEAAVGDARLNAARNGISAEYVCAKAEDALGVLEKGSAQTAVVVDPPRAGLHPRVAAALAGFSASSLVYVACRPSSLGRDARVLVAGGWRLTDLWPVDLFPQTGHIEIVGRFTR